MIQIGKKEYESIIQHAIIGLPNEACGLVGGELIDGIKVIKEVYLLTNLDESSEHFTMDPREQLGAMKDLRSKGYELFGNFHSHPQTPSRPSEEDIKLAYDPKSSYLILSLQNEEPVLKAFQIIGGVVTEETILFLE